MEQERSRLSKLSKDVLLQLIVKDHVNEVYVLYYHSESSGDDGIVSVHRTLQGAVDKVIAIEKENGNYDEDEDYTPNEEPHYTKGVNMPGWSVGLYNIYPVSFEN
jgi:hypothetical protein